MSILGELPATRRRFAPGSHATGVFVPGASTDLPIQATELPLTGEDMAVLAEGDRKRSPRKFLTETELLTVDQSTTNSADQVLVDSRTFEVHNVKRVKTILTPFRALCLEIQEADA